MKSAREILNSQDYENLLKYLEDNRSSFKRVGSYELMLRNPNDIDLLANLSDIKEPIINRLIACLKDSVTAHANSYGGGFINIKSGRYDYH